MIFPNLNVTHPPMEQGSTRLHRVLPIQASLPLQDYTQQRESQSGEEESGTKKQTESLAKHQQEEQGFTDTVKTIYEETYSKPICLTSKCSTPLNPYLTKSTTFTAWKIHSILTTYKSLEQLTALQSSKVNLVS